MNPRLLPAMAAALAALILGGCTAVPPGSPEVASSSDPQFDFAGAKTYRWSGTQPNFRPDPLLEANVRFLVDQALAAKGMTKKEGADLLIGIGYDFGYRSMSYGYEVRALSLSISRADSNALVWRGLATGSINADTASADLKNAVDAMLARLP